MSDPLRVASEWLLGTVPGVLLLSVVGGLALDGLYRVVARLRSRRTLLAEIDDLYGRLLAGDSAGAVLPFLLFVLGGAALYLTFAIILMLGAAATLASAVTQREASAGLSLAFGALGVAALVRGGSLVMGLGRVATAAQRALLRAMEVPTPSGPTAGGPAPRGVGPSAQS